MAATLKYEHSIVDISGISTDILCRVLHKYFEELDRELQA